MLELYVRRADGTGAVVLTATDDAIGRREIDKAAFAAMASASVESASVKRTDRVAKSRKGSAR